MARFGEWQLSLSCFKSANYATRKSARQAIANDRNFD